MTPVSTHIPPDRSSQANITHITPVRHADYKGEGIDDEGKGKKYALKKGVEAATTPYVWLHDNDIVLPDAAQANAISGLNADLYILPLRMVGGNTLLEKLQKVEYQALQNFTIYFVLRHNPILCSGANLIVRRNEWLEAYPDIYPELPSGDDMFLLDSFKRHGKTISTITDPSFCATVRTIPTWRAFFRQRMRWAGKAAHYKDLGIRLVGLAVAFANILCVVFPFAYPIKFIFEWDCYRMSYARSEKVKGAFFVALLLSLLYPYYMLVCLFGGLRHQDRW